MSKFTSLEFMDALGLNYMDYNGAKILLRLLSEKGIAKEVGKISLTGKGRKQTIYEIPEEFTIKIKHTGNTLTHKESIESYMSSKKIIKPNFTNENQEQEIEELGT